MILFIDTETTALIKNSALPLSRQPHIIEFFGLKTEEDGKEIGSYHSLVKPPIHIPEEVTRITGMTDDTVKSAPPFASVEREITECLVEASEVVAHNLAYDKTVLGFEYERLQRSMPVMKKMTCTVEATEFLHGYRLSLTDLHMKLFGETFHAHRAEDDVRAMARCYFELKSKGLI